MLVPLIGQIVIQVAFQAGALLIYQRMSWFVPVDIDPQSDNIVCYENSVRAL